ncbi:MAG: SRPBCC family protein [Caldilineales bacterium]
MSDQVTKSIIVKGSLDEIYGIWADFSNFPRFMTNIDSVTPRGEDRSHWVMKGPLGARFEWDAKTTLMEKNSRIAWKSVNGNGSNMKTSGQVTFKELPHEEIQITVTLQYVPPAGAVGEAAVNLFGKPEQRLSEDLKNFKSFVEAKREHTLSSA